MLPTMWGQKLNKLDDIKNFQFLKRGIGIEGEKLLKQDRDQRNKLENKLENGNQLKMKLKV